MFELQLSDLQKKAARKFVSPLEFANVYACLKRKDEALRYLEEAHQKHAPRLVRIQSEPDFDFLHSDARYQSIIKKMGLPTVPRGRLALGVAADQKPAGRRQGDAYTNRFPCRPA
jgi:hypothetical protein